MLSRLLSSSVALVGCLLWASACGPSGALPAVPGQAPVTLTYLGVAGWEFDASGHTLLFDPYFSRKRIIKGGVLIPDEKVIAAHTPARVDAVLVGHSHYDHLLDVPTLAKATNAVVVGTESTIHVARMAGVLEPELRVARGTKGEVFDIGPFRVRPVRALHSMTGQANTTIPPDVQLPGTADAYAEGGTLQYVVEAAGRTIFFSGTANFIESELAGIHPDIAIVAVGLREKIPDYSCRLMRALGQPKIVYANHFDAFMNPLGPKQMEIGDDGVADLAKFASEIHACSPETKVIVPEHLRPMKI